MIVRRVEGDMGFFSVIKQWGFVVQDNEIFYLTFLPKQKKVSKNCI
jgi:hypothetical protein